MRSGSELEGLWSARRGTHHILRKIDETARTVIVIRIAHPQGHLPTPARYEISARAADPRYGAVVEERSATMGRDPSRTYEKRSSIAPDQRKYLQTLPARRFLSQLGDTLRVWLKPSSSRN